MEEENPIVVGCNYHTTWQSHRNMRFILESVDGENAILTTRTSRNHIPCKVSDLIFIQSKHNTNKATILKTKL